MKSRPDLIRNNQCPTCGQYFHHLGIARHRAMHRDERDSLRTYIVSFREVAEVTEIVLATSKAHAIRLVKAGEGERVGFEIDEFLVPTNFRANEDNRGDPDDPPTCQLDSIN